MLELMLLELLIGFQLWWMLIMLGGCVDFNMSIDQLLWDANYVLVSWIGLKVKTILNC